MIVAFIILFAFLNTLSICSLFFKLTLSENQLVVKQKIFLVLGMNLVILGFGFSPFVWAQIPACGLLLFVVIKKFKYTMSDWRTLVFIISVVLLLISLINYFEGLAANYLGNYFSDSYYVFFIVSLAFQLLNLLFIYLCPNRIYGQTFRAVSTNNFYKATFLILFVSLALFVLYTGTRPPVNVHNGFGLSSEALAILITLGLFVIFGLINYGMQRQEQNMQKELMNNLTAYTREIEDMYDELSMFRHDYLNILFSLRLAIEERDIDKVEKIFKDSIMPTEKIINDEGYEVAKLNQIKIPEIKSLLHMKISSAKAEGIEVSVDIPAKIFSLDIDTVVYIRIISILLDNAIENARQSVEKKISLSIFEYENIHTFIIGNSTKETEMDLNKIFQKDFSKKENPKNEHGWGLYYLKSIILKTDKIMLETKLEDAFFSQIIRIDKVKS